MKNVLAHPLLMKREHPNSEEPEAEKDRCNGCEIIRGITKDKIKNF